jgi:AraC family transcriptional regulator
VSTGAHQSSAEALDSLVPGTRVAAAKGHAWKDLLIQVFERSRHQESLLIPAVPEPLIVWVLSGDARVEERELGGQWVENRVTAGDFFLTNAPEPYELRWQAQGEQPFSVMHLYIGLPLIQRAVIELMGRDAHLELRDVSGEKDPILSALLEPLRTELMLSRAPSPMFVQGLAQSLAIHVVRHYGRASEAVPRPRGGLPAFKLHRVTEMMAAQLDQAFQLARLARHSGLSEFHFGRAFKKSTGYTPSQYFIRMRMEHARRLLRETDQPVIEIALEVGYTSASHFSQVFRREVGVTPREYRGGN